MKLTHLHNCILDELDTAEQTADLLAHRLGCGLLDVRAALDGLVIDDRLVAFGSAQNPIYRHAEPRKPWDHAAPPLNSEPEPEPEPPAEPMPAKGRRRSPEEIDAIVIDALRRGPSSRQRLLDITTLATVPLDHSLARLQRQRRVARGDDRRFRLLAAGESGANESPRPEPGLRRPPVVGMGTGIDLNRISARVAPIQQLSEKVAVLDALSGVIDGSVGAVLREIRGDLERIGSAA